MKPARRATVVFRGGVKFRPKKWLYLPKK